MLFTYDYFRLQNLELKLDLAKKIHDFMNQPDVISGKAFQIGNVPPNGWYEAISTTGYCVKVSEVFLERMLTEDLYKYAKVLSITIDDNIFGKCGDGSHNAWHTCVDTGLGYVIDLTIAQFGSKYNNRFIWWKTDWLKEFQSPTDTHNVGLTPDPDNIPSYAAPYTKISTLPEEAQIHNDVKKFISTF